MEIKSARQLNRVRTECELASDRTLQVGASLEDVGRAQIGSDL